jgi:RNase P/RNase MRP subunit p29
MAFAFQRRRGTTTAHTSFTGLAGELTVDTTKNTVVVHNGSTAGGFPLSKQRTSFATTSGTTYTLAITDADGALTTTSASATTVTLPPSVFAAGDIVTIIQTGAGQVTFSQGSGVTIQSVGGTATAPKIRVQYAGAQVICTTGGATPTFVVVGDIV